MATKKRKRFSGGGITEEEDKKRGLEASKDDKVGFFERLRMGNIDQEGSEAYRRFGAGRGKAERVPVEDRVATPVTRPSATPTTPEKEPEMDELEAANKRKPIDVEAGPRAEPPKPGGRARVNVQASKPSAPAPSKTPAKNPNYSNEGRGKGSPKSLVDQIPKDKSMSLMDQIPRDRSTVVGGEKVDSTELGRNVMNALGGFGPGRAAGVVRGGVEAARAGRVQDAYNKAATARRTAEMRAKGDATKFASKAKSTDKNPAKKTKKFDDEESNVEFKRGGIVSSASKRADGIATKGKTRCKMR